MNGEYNETRQINLIDIYSIHSNENNTAISNVGIFLQSGSKDECKLEHFQGNLLRGIENSIYSFFLHLFSSKAKLF